MTRDHGTGIEWTHGAGFKGETWNPTTGCDRVSPGCAKCYALTLAARMKAMGVKAYQNDGDPRTSGPGFALTLHPDRLDRPIRWTKPRMIFVNSMSDLFHEQVPDEFIGQVFEVMARCPQHVFQILTKRPERARDVVTALYDRSADAFGHAAGATASWPPLRNVWLGTSIENSRFTWRADVLREIPAAVRFISAEPLLGSLFRSRHGLLPKPEFTDPTSKVRRLDLSGIDWLIAGGESGPGHRPVDLDHVRELRDACLDTPTAFFLKQIGGPTPKSGGKMLDGREWCEMPQVAA